MAGWTRWMIGLAVVAGCGGADETPTDTTESSSSGGDDSDGTSSATTTGSDGEASTSTDSSTDAPADSSTTGDDTTGDDTTGGDSSTSHGSSSESSTDATTDGTTTGNDGCGDGSVGPGEQCDGDDLQDFDCQSLGYASGDLECDPVTCMFDESNCSEEPGDCGNGGIDPGEQCDGDDLQGFTCENLGLDEGDLACDPITCTFDTSDCNVLAECGDGDIDPGEQCDGTNLQGFTCVLLGLEPGVLQCNPNCTFNVNLCGDCGDGDIDPGEQCDGDDVGGLTCEDVGLGGGTGQLACDPATCMLDFFSCI